MIVHTHKHTHVHRHMYTHTYIHADTCTDTHMYIPHRHTHTHKKVAILRLFTHRSGYCTLGGQRAQHNTPCFHCAQLLSSLTAPSANDRSGLSSEPAQQNGPGGHTCPHHNF
ncbi:unnamed protein product [Staurois parvus]|uniref:Uncharacterized protein n=1 Tax=Staurois parvus TaxID=386267 RepID=A0ABN9CMN6_9NEOB|nr:unnamed protein product [Staurois parvus]